MPFLFLRPGNMRAVRSGTIDIALRSRDHVHAFLETFHCLRTPTPRKVPETEIRDTAHDTVDTARLSSRRAALVASGLARARPPLARPPLPRPPLPERRAKYAGAAAGGATAGAAGACMLAPAQPAPDNATRDASPCYNVCAAGSGVLSCV
eukprot:scaffold58121_cov74-Phaeocystis_antarctica.AAC.4